jgi:hypothetical protein
MEMRIEENSAVAPVVAVVVSKKQVVFLGPEALENG